MIRGVRMRVGRPHGADLLVLEQDVVGVEEVEQVDVRLDRRAAHAEALGEPQVDELRDVLGPIRAAGHESDGLAGLRGGQPVNVTVRLSGSPARDDCRRT